MNYEAFVEHVKELIKDQLPRGWEESVVSIRTVDKINLTRTGLVFDRGEHYSPTIYLEELYERYEHGMNLEEVIENVREILSECGLSEKFRVTREMLAEKQDRIIFQVVNTQENQELLSKMPHRSFEDLSVIYLWFLSCDENGLLTIPIENSVAALFDYSEEQLFQWAYENTKEVLPLVVRPMRQMIEELLQGIHTEIEQEEPLEKGGEMYVFTNEAKTFGAATLLYPDVFDEVANMQGDDLYILPSSRHEVISLPKNAADLEDVIEMVEMTNETHASVEDALSHQVYQYDRSAREITKVTNVPHRAFGERYGKPDKEEIKERNTSR